MMAENKGKIYDVIIRIPRVNNEEALKVLTILDEASKEFPNISKYYFSSDDRVGGGGFKYQQYVQDVQKWQKKWLGSTKR
jgi:hypothetical protein